MEDKVISSDIAQQLLAELRDRKELVQFTFENNTIKDINAVCDVFRYLRHFDKLESLNFRCNNNFNDDVVNALSDGITHKKELRVSFIQFDYK